MNFNQNQLTTLQNQSQDTKKAFLKMQSNNNFLSFSGVLFYAMKIDGKTTLFKQFSNGTIISEIDFSATILGGVEIFNDTSVFVNLQGRNNVALWDHVSNNIQYLPFTTHHNLVYNYEKETFLTLQYEEVSGFQDPLLFDTIIEYDINGNKIWEFNFSSIIEEYSNEFFINNLIDVTHANSLQWDFENQKILVNLRNLNQIYQIDYQTQNVDWILGENGDFFLYNLENQLVSSLFQEAHDLHLIDSSTILLFDNKFRLPTTNELRSRLIEISYDFNNSSAKIINEWVAPGEFYSPIWGSVEKLPNGNFLASFGYNDIPSIIEVNMTSQEYSQFEIANRFFNVAFYYSSPIILLQESYNLLSGMNIQFNYTGFASYSWNFEETFNHIIYLNNTLISSTNESLHSNWKLSDLSITFPILNNGIYNLTIIVNSIFGSQSVHSSLLHVKDFFFNSPGDIFIEDGQEINLKFSGLFKSIVYLKLEIVDDLLLNSTWDGEEVILNQTLMPDEYLFGYEIYNSTHSLILGNFSLVIEIQQAPIFSILNPLIFEWGETIAIIIDVTETSAYELTLEFDGISWLHNTYPNSDELVTITLPQLSESIHEFDIILRDELLLSSTQNIEISIVSPQKPVIVSTIPSDLDWGKPTTLIWEVHGADNVQLYRDSQLLEQKNLTSLLFSYQVDWRERSWELINYNLTLIASNNNNNNQSISSNIIAVNVLVPNSFGSSIVHRQTSWTLNADFALGEPDGATAEIQFGYENGRILIDINAISVNTSENDLTVYATGGEYRILVSLEKDGTYTSLGNGQGTNSFEFGMMDQVQFVMVEYITGSPILLDAIEGHSISENDRGELYDLDLPSIQISSDISSYPLIWNISDYLGINYSIFVNGINQISTIWYGEAISFNLIINQNINFYNVTIETFNILGNHTQGYLEITVVSNSNLIIYSVVIGSILFIALVYLIIRRFK